MERTGPQDCGPFHTVTLSGGRQAVSAALRTLAAGTYSVEITPPDATVPADAAREVCVTLRTLRTPEDAVA